jgi:hypothetical protein
MLTKPSFPVWLLCVAGGAFGVAVKLVPALAASTFLLSISFWIVAGALALLVLACLLPML